MMNTSGYMVKLLPTFQAKANMVVLAASAVCATAALHLLREGRLG